MGLTPDPDQARERELVNMERERERDDYFAGLPEDDFTEPEAECRQVLLDALEGKGSVRFSLIAQQDAVRQAKAGLRLPKCVTLSQWIDRRVGSEIIGVKDPTGEIMIHLAGEDATPPDQQDEEFFGGLPADRFTREEEALREELLASLERNGGRAAMRTLTQGPEGQQLHHARSKLLPKGMKLALWIERRLGEEVLLVTDPDRGGQVVELANPLPKRQTSKRKQVAEERRLHQDEPEEERAARIAAEQMEREARREEFFASLPEDELTPEEKALRKALLQAWVAKYRNGVGPPLRLSILCQDDAVRAAKFALLPDGVVVGAWVEARIGAEVVLSKDEHGNAMAEVAPATAKSVCQSLGHQARGLVQAGKGGGPPTMNQGKGSTLSVHSKGGVPSVPLRGPLTSDELQLRDALVAALMRKGQTPEGGLPRLSTLKNRDHAMATAWGAVKASMLQANPSKEPTLDQWIELRIPGEVSVVWEPSVKLSNGFLERGGHPQKRPLGAAPLQPPPKVGRQAGMSNVYRPPH